MSHKMLLIRCLTFGVAALFCSALLANDNTREALNVTLTALDGAAVVKLSDFPGQPVLVNLWGSHCVPCIKEMPLLNEQSRSYTRVRFIGVAMDDPDSSIRLIRQFKIGYTQLQAPEDRTAMLRSFGDTLGVLPFTVMLDAKHRICASRLGEVNRFWIDRVLKECSSY